MFFYRSAHGAAQAKARRLYTPAQWWNFLHQRFAFCCGFIEWLQLRRFALRYRRIALAGRLAVRDAQPHPMTQRIAGIRRDLPATISGFVCTPHRQRKPLRRGRHCVAGGSVGYWSSFPVLALKRPTSQADDR